jgi:hypothetical protein
VFESVFGIDNLRSVLAAAAYHAERVRFVRTYVDDSAVVFADFNPASGWTNTANTFLPVEILPRSL